MECRDVETKIQIYPCKHLPPFFGGFFAHNVAVLAVGLCRHPIVRLHQTRREAAAGDQRQIDIPGKGAKQRFSRTEQDRNGCDHHIGHQPFSQERLYDLPTIKIDATGVLPRQIVEHLLWRAAGKLYFAPQRVGYGRVGQLSGEHQYGPVIRPCLKGPHLLIAPRPITIQSLSAMKAV